jgi:hypothetical protein
MASRERQHLYGSRFWRRRAKLQLRHEPTCRMCLAEGLVRPAVCADHITRWVTVNEFYRGELQSLCAEHHNIDKQRNERGFVPRIRWRFDLDGNPIWPDDDA